MVSVDLEVQLGQLYNKYRTVLLNRKYYGHRLARAQRISLVLEIIIALVSSSAVGAWAIWKDELGTIIWPLLIGVAAVVATIKPLLHLPKQIERYTKLFVGYGDVFWELDRLIDEVREKKTFSTNNKKTYNAALEKIKTLESEDDPKPSKKLRIKYYNEVNQERPPESLKIPGI